MAAAKKKVTKKVAPKTTTTQKTVSTKKINPTTTVKKITTTTTKTIPKKKTFPQVPQIKPKTTEDLLIENFVSLQKVMANLSVKFDNLSEKMSSLLDLFEISAKSLAENDIKISADPKESKKILEKIDELSDQNKIIARGLTLLHESSGEQRMPPVQPQMPPKMPPQMELQQENQEQPSIPTSKMIQGSMTQESGGEQYQKSISSSGAPERKFNRLPKL